MPMDNAAWTKWITSIYTQIKIYTDKELAVAFKATCAADGVSIAAVLSELMTAYCGRTLRHPKFSVPDYSTHGRRRNAVKQAIGQLEAITEADTKYKDNIPENL